LIEAAPRIPLLKAMASKAEQEVLTVNGRDVAISNPRKIFLLDAGYTKLDLRLDRPA
jgi:hypothetical protein